MPAWLAPALGLAGSLLGGSKDKKTTTEVKRPAWQDAAMQSAITGLQGSPVAQLDPNKLTANLNPYVMDALMQAGQYSQGQGADQVAMINSMGFGQKDSADQLAALSRAQAGLGAGAIGGAGSFILDQLNNAGSTGYGNVPGLEGINNLGKNLLDGNLKFQYDQGTYDQAYNNLIGSAQGAFDSYSDRTKTNNLFQNLPGLKMGSQLLGGSNSKVGQQSSLLDSITNQQIMDFGAQQAQWAAGAANNAAMTAGQGNQNTALGQYGYDSSRAQNALNTATQAATQRYAANLSAASNMYGQGANMMSNAGTSMANAGQTYGSAANTFGNANTAQTTNMNTSLVAGDYLQNYDQESLDRWNNANIFNTQQPFSMNLDMYNAFAGTPAGSATTQNGNLINQVGQGLALGGALGEAFPDVFG